MTNTKQTAKKTAKQTAQQTAAPDWQKHTVSGCYAGRHAECQDLLKRIASRLEQHQKDQAQEPANWGYSKALRHAAEDLAYVLAFLGDRSALDAKGLVY